MKNSRLPSRVSTTQRVTSWGVIGVLVIIAAGVLWKQSRYDQSFFRPTAVYASAGHAAHNASAVVLREDEDDAAGIATGEKASAASLEKYAPPELRPLSAAEQFDSQTLSDKINGKAELYLQAGFQKMEAQRFALKNDEAKWLELFVYDMGKPLNAFSVLSNQRRTGGVESDIAEHAYSAAGSYYLTSGNSYLEIIPAENDPTLVAAADAIARNYVKSSTPSETEAAPESLLPPEGLERDTVKLLLTSAFGCEALTDVVAGDYVVDGTTVTAFVSVRNSEDEAKQAAEAYHKMLVEDLAADQIESIVIPGIYAVDMLGAELFFTHGKVLAGVHAAGTKEAGESLVLRIYEHVKGAAK
jgi:hypothetical protein